MKESWNPVARLAILLALMFCAGCSTTDTYFEPAMDFGSLEAVAVLPFQDLTQGHDAARRVRDTFVGMLLASEAVYVLPLGEVALGLSKIKGLPREGPSAAQIRELSKILKVEAVITGVLREYGTVRSGSTSANVVSLSLQMIEATTGRVIWSASSTKGGVTMWDRLLGTRAEPMNVVTEEVVNDLLDRLFE